VTETEFGWLTKKPVQALPSTSSARANNAAAYIGFPRKLRIYKSSASKIRATIGLKQLTKL
jgi:hypothetical protein